MPPFFSLVKELKSSTTLWAMRLSLIRSFEVPAYNNKNEVASFEFIFQDKEGDRMTTMISIFGEQVRIG
ncbi:hypothetical protein OROGR_028504 [Orobanche gracilis]